MKRSLLVTHSSRWNGETEYAAGLVKAEVRMGMNVTVVAPRESTFAGEVAGSVHLLELPGKAPSRSPVDFLKDLVWLSHLIGTGDFDILHSSRATAHFLTACAARKRVPLLHLRGGAKKPYGHPGNRFLYRRLTDGVIVSSSRVEGWVREHLHVPRERVHRILSPVDVEQFQPAPPDPALFQELGIPVTSPLIVKVARLAPVKGHDRLLEAMASVHRRFPRVVLVLVGNPWEGQPGLLKRQAEELGIGGVVVFAGRRKDIPRFLASAAVCVSSSIGSEENSRAVGEYMASARPVVATAVGVIPELVADGETGLLVLPRDPGALAEAIASVLADPERARRMGEAGRRRAVSEFSEEIFDRRLRAVIDSVIN
ncbi:MAG: glycosyltransferase family 4 protein [PVC group bacterium]